MAAGDSYAGIAVPDGDPAALEELAGTFTAMAGGMDEVAGVFRGMPGLMPGWLGPASVLFASATGLGDGGARSVTNTLATNGRAVRGYADDLRAAQRKAENAIELARDAIRRIERAEELIADAQLRRAAAELAEVGAAVGLAAGAPGAASAIEGARGQADRAAEDEARARRMLEDARDDLERARREGREADDQAEQAASRAAGVMGTSGGGGSLLGLGLPARAGGGSASPLAAIMFGPTVGGAGARGAFGDLAPFLGVFAALSNAFGEGGRVGDREDRRIRNDDRLGIPPGGRTGRDRDRGGDFENDWAGRELLQRYLTGGDTLTIENDSDWNEYMMANPLLTQQLDRIVRTKALQAYDDYHQDDIVYQTFNDTSQMEIQNGEGISGYQYLHGTNEEVGGFEHQGSAQIKPVDGGYEVRIPGDFTWNDRIDPNGQYTTDKVKSTIAEIVTLSKADGYDLHLTWPADTTVRLDEAGNVVSVEGYPGG